MLYLISYNSYSSYLIDNKERNKIDWIGSLK